jgi:hypothetical protein
MKFGIAAATSSSSVGGSGSTSTTPGTGSSGSSGSGSSGGGSSGSNTGTAAVSATLDSSSFTASAGQSVTFTAALLGSTGTPTGTVAFQDNGTTLSACASVALASGKATCTTSSLASGTHAITGAYSGDATYATGVAGPITQTVTGSASAPPTAGVSGASLGAAITVGSLTVSAGSIDFGGESMGATTPAQAITVTNKGSASVTVSGITASGPFAQSSNCASLAAGASCTISVTFTPVVSSGALNSTAAASGALTLATSAGSGTVTLAGTGEKSLVTHYYESILRRTPDAGGKAFWQSEAARVASLGANVDEAWYALAAQFYMSAEYTALQRDNTGFVTDLYNTFFDRAPDAGGLAYWLGQIAGGMPRSALLASFMYSAEFANLTQSVFGTGTSRAESDIVTDFYRGLLDRLPDSDGYTYWTGQFRAAQCQGSAAVYAQSDAISKAFVNGAEYAARNRSNADYVSDLYTTFMRRGGDASGIAAWQQKLDSGALTREQVRQAFVGSTEFAQRVAAVAAQGCAQ